MLQGNFFHIKSMQTEGEVTKATLTINAAHQIFEGHFPGKPVVPGVCMLQIIKELTEIVAGKTTRLIKADEMKFLAVISPVENTIIQAELKHTYAGDGNLQVSGKLFSEAYTHFKIKASFVHEESEYDN